SFSFYRSMGIFSLPDVFMRKLMRTMEIGDRLSLRLTCRAFEQIVADSHAGYFENGYMELFREGVEEEIGVNFTFSIGERFLAFEMAEDEFEKCLNLRHRLFNGISIGSVNFELPNALPIHMDFIREFINKFEIKELHFYMSIDRDLENALQLLSHYPTSACLMSFWYLPALRLLTLPPLERLFVHNIEGSSLFSTELFVRLVETQKNLEIVGHHVLLSTNEFQRIIRAISEDNRKRKIVLELLCSNVVSILRDRGISENSKDGDICGDFTIAYNEPHTAPNNRSQLKMSDGKCVLLFVNFSWTGLACRPSVSISNFPIV
ncbi:hypothetical protein PENTCL1PPCAC_13314, partial [Pristionchus entomophagus]